MPMNMQIDNMEQVKDCRDIPLPLTTRWGFKLNVFASRDMVCRDISLVRRSRATGGGFSTKNTVDWSRSGYQQKDRKPSQNDKTEHGMEKTVQNQGQSPKMSKSESILKNNSQTGAGTEEILLNANLTHQKDRKPSQNDKTEHGMEKTVQNQGQSPKMPKSESIQKNQQSNRSRN
ncbi:hypothetical protein Tco_0435628 [Tanacetum coccineum]